MGAPIPFDHESLATRLATRCARTTGATYFDGERLHTFGPNEPRWTKGGLLVEEKSTNHLLFSEKPRSQRVRLRPRTYTVSCYVKGDAQVRLTADGRSFLLVPQG